MAYLKLYSLLLFAGLMALATINVKADAIPLILAQRYTQSVDIQHYWVSEKLDGVRAYWDGKHLITRNGNRINAPLWFTENFPSIPLDGELWLGRQRFEELSGIVRKAVPLDEEWKQVKYLLFELPEDPGATETARDFTQRLALLQSITRQANIAWLQVVPQHKVTTHQALDKLLHKTVKMGGEGLMLHRAGSLYHTGRSHDLLKLTPFIDAEATVVSHLEGRGKYRGMMGALRVEMPNGKAFKIGSGFTDAQRKNPPAIGSTVTFRYRELTREGSPRFPVFVRVREEQ
jgi:DNA ligase-1